jgi:hypothetical protein
MRHVAVVVGLCSVLAGSAFGLTLESPKVDATLFTDSSKDRFKIRAQLGGADPAAVAAGSMILRFGDLQTRIPAGGFRPRGKKSFVWRSFLLGVKKVTINVKKGTLTVVGGGQELGDLPGPTMLAIATSQGATCGQMSWGKTKGKKKRVRKRAEGPFPACEGGIGSPATAPQVVIDSPTALAGTTTAGGTITIGGRASDDQAVASLAWSSDRGGGGLLTPADTWSVVDVPLLPGDNVLTVTATDGDGHTGSDVLVVTYNLNGLVFVGQPVADPDALAEGTRRTITVRQLLATNPDLDPESVQLLEVAAGGATTPLTLLVDDGDRTKGDQIQGDGHYSGRTSFDAFEPGARRYRVAARTLSQPESTAFSPILTVPTIEPIPSSALSTAIALADDALSILNALVTSGTPEAEIAQNVSDLARAHGALAVGLAAGGRAAWWVTADGLLGGALADAANGPVALTPAPRESPPPALRVQRAAMEAEAIQVGTRRTLVLAPALGNSDVSQVGTTIAGVECPIFDVDEVTGSLAGAEAFQDLETYGLIVVDARGDALFSGIGDAYRPEWEWQSLGPQGVVVTGTTLGSGTLGTWERDLRLGRMAVMPGGQAAILPSFIVRYSIGLPGTLVYLGSANGAASGLSAAFLSLGATTVLGWDGPVSPVSARTRALSVVGELLTGKTAGESFTPGQTDGGTPPATLTLAGSPQTGIATDVIVNGGFEFTSGFSASVTGFTVQGDGHVVGGLGTWGPTEGERMALVSTGLGLTTAVGSFEQSLCLPSLPPGASSLTLTFDWNFFSEEFLEYCGSQFQDSFEVTFGDTTLLSRAVDDLCDSVFPDAVDFDQGDVHATGWLTHAVDMTPFAGTTGALKFGAEDVGDSIFDTVILVDRLSLTAE